jgi:pyrophosphatase PpaX
VKFPCVLFDLDGTLINTNDLILASFMHTLNTHCPGKYTEADVLACMGEPLVDQMRRFDPERADEMVKTYHTHNEAHHDEFVTEFPYVREVLQQMHTAGVKMGVVSNKRRKVVEMGLKLFGLDRFMQTVICIGDAEKAKPEPDMIFLAMDRLGVPRDQTLMVGDSRYDLLAAQRAGVASAAVAWSLHAEELKEYDPNYFLKDMRDLLEVQGIIPAVRKSQGDAT